MLPRRLLWFFGLGFCALFLLIVHEYHLLFDGKFHFYMIDVPEGDGFLLRTPHGKNIFVDGGTDATPVGKLGALLPFWNAQVDLLVITHPDLDHLAGGVFVLKKYPVRNVLLTAVPSKNAAFSELLRIIKERNISLSFGSAQTDFKVDGVFFDTLFPSKIFAGASVFSTNNSALVFRVQFAGNSLLLTSDIEAEVEKALLLEPLNLRSTVLKVGHHGSKTSSTPAFLQAVQPRYALISAGPKNRFGHPHKEALDRIHANTPARIFVTKECGDIDLSWSKEGNMNLHSNCPL